MKRKQNHRGRDEQWRRKWKRIVWFAARLNLYHVYASDITIGRYSSRTDPRYNLVCVMVAHFASVIGRNDRDCLKKLRHYYRTGRPMHNVTVYERTNEVPF